MEFTNSSLTSASSGGQPLQYGDNDLSMTLTIPCDTWNMFLNLVDCFGWLGEFDSAKYDDTQAWPTLFDDFIEFENDSLNQNTISNNENNSLKRQNSNLNQNINLNLMS